jgi:transcriptional regulator NrdR family protein
MICINCSYPKTQVVNSRPHKTQSRVWRRRLCPQCNTLVSTYELIDTADQQRVGDQPYSVARMAMSLYGFLPKSNHSADDAFALAQTIGESLSSLEQSSLTSQSLAGMAWHTLSRFNKKAGLKYGIEHDCIDASGVR